MLLVVPDELNVEILLLFFFAIRLKFLNSETCKNGRSDIFFILDIDLNKLLEINLYYSNVYNEIEKFLLC